MSILVDLRPPSSRPNTLLERKFRRKLIVGTLQAFAIGQVIRIARDPLRLETGDRNFGGLVLRRATEAEFIAQCPDAGRPHNRNLIMNANFYEVGVD